MIQEDEFKSTRQVLELIGLTQDEINAFFQLTGRGPVMVGEIALICDVPDERASGIAKKLLEKGLVREIPGKTPFYMALPPYTALLNQIKNFKEMVSKIRESTPKALQSKFKDIEEQSEKLGRFEEYRNYIQMMKTNLPLQIKSQFSKVESELDKVKQFQEIRSFILNLREIVPEEIIKEFAIVETRLEKIKSEIAEAFEKQFRIGALSSLAEKIVSRIISEQFMDLTDYFKDKFVTTIQNTLDQVTNQLASISDAAGEMSTDLGGTITDIQSGLKDTLEELDSRISTVYQDVEKGIEELKNLFQKEIYETLERDIMKNIVDQLELSEETMNEFWERSKKASMLSYKDVWFVRSIEGMKAQVNEALTRLKARAHIITPSLDDIDVVAISNIKKFVNVRISTNFDMNSLKDQEKLNQLLKYPNVSLRLYPRENLYAINRDFEEVVVCVTSKTELGDFEIAGMGSILEEHVKLFAGVLEDVWIQGKKIGSEDFTYSADSSTIPSQTDISSKSPKQPYLEKEKPLISLPKTAPVPTPTQISSKPINDSTLDPLKQKPQAMEPKLSQSTYLKSTLNQQFTTSTPKPQKSGTVSELFDNLVNNITNKTGAEISSELENIRNRITEELGYSSILGQMSITIAGLKTIPKTLTTLEVEDTKKKIEFWRQKSNF